MSRAYTAGRFALEIDGIAGGWLYSCEGGNTISEVVSEKLPLEHHVRKHIAGVKFEDISFTCGTGMSKGFWHKMKESFDDSVKRVDGVIHYCDYDSHIRMSREFHQALVTEVGFPALDASSKDAAKMTFKLAPEWTQLKKGDGSKISGSQYSIGSGQQKKWLPSNFRLSIDGLDKACKWVNKVDALSIKQKVVDSLLGETREPRREPADISLPNMVITAPESHMRSFLD